jgi:hypothetical protein
VLALDPSGTKRPSAAIVTAAAASDRTVEVDSSSTVSDIAASPCRLPTFHPPLDKSTRQITMWKLRNPRAGGMATSPVL